MSTSFRSTSRALAAFLLFSTVLTPFAPVMAQEATAEASIVSPVTTEVELAAPTVAETPVVSEPAPEVPSTEQVVDDQDAKDKTKDDKLTKDKDKSKDDLGDVQVMSMSQPGLGTPIVPKAGSVGVVLDKPTLASNTGALTYAHPIQLPQGRGPTPEVSLTYNSQDARDRGFGYGWSISIPSIERLPKHGSNNLYAEDYFTSSLSGELAKVDSTHYGAKRERGDFLDYAFSNNTWTVSTKTGLTYVFGKTAAARQTDSASSGRTFAWMLSEIVDANGNLAKYSYVNGTANDIYPSMIQYPIWRNPSTGAETNPIFQVSLTTANRETVLAGTTRPSSARPGFVVEQTRLLKQIDIIKTDAGNDLNSTQGYLDPDGHRIYKLTYSLGSNGTRALLTSISSNWTNYYAQNLGGLSTTFSYGAGTTQSQAWSASSWQFPSDSSILFSEGWDGDSGIGTYGNSRLADVNGDGLPDLISGTNVHLNTGSGWQASSTWTLPTFPYPSYSGCPASNFQITISGTMNPSINGSIDGRRVQIVDINGDGRADILAMNMQVICYYNHAFPFSAAFISTPNGWTRDDSWLNITGNNVEDIVFGDAAQDNGCRIADINGDGLVDIVRSSIGSTPRFYLNDGSGWNETTSFSLPVVGWCRDYYGTNIYYPLAFKGTSWDATVPLSFEDINGDGLQDLVLDGEFCTNPNYSNLTSNRVYVNTGTTWVDAGPTASSSVIYGAKRVVGDANGDGFGPDYLYSQSESTSSGEAGQPYQNEGAFPLIDGFNGPYHDTSTVGSSRRWAFPIRTGCNGSTSYRVGFRQPYWSGSTGTKTAPSGIQVVDVDGDGLTDLTAINSLKPCDTSTSGPRESVFWKNQHPKTDLLISVSNPYRGTTTVTYSMATQVTDDVTGARLTSTASVNLPIVTRLVTSGGTGSAVQTDYTYSGEAYRVGAYDDREFAGFRTVTAHDSNGATVKTWYHQGDGNDAASYENDDHGSKTGLAYRVERRDNNGSLRETVITRYSRASASSLAGDRWFVAPASALEVRNAADSSTATTAQAWQYDSANGNLAQTTDYGDVTPASDGTFTDLTTDPAVTTAYSYATSAGSARLIGLVTQSLKTDQSSAILGRERRLYDGLSLGQASIGNLTSVRTLVTSSPETEAETSSTYSSTGQIATFTDARGNVTTYGYGSYDLYPTTETRAVGGNQLTTTNHYHWTLGIRTGQTDPSSLKENDDYDGYGRATAHHAGSPSLTYQTTDAWGYTDPSSSGITYGLGTSHVIYGSGNGTTVENTYADGLGRTVRVAKTLPDPAGSGSAAWSVTDTVYDAQGRVQKTSLPFLGTPSATLDPRLSGALQAPTDYRQWTAYAYDGLGRVLTTTTAVGVTTNAYGARTTTTTDPLNRYKILTNDARGRLVQVTERNRNGQSNWENYVTTYAYDANGNLTGLTDADGNVRGFTYDLLGRRLTAQDLHAQSDATYGTWAYAYDENGNVTQETKPSGAVTTYAYDALNRVTQRSTTGLAARNFTNDASCPMGAGRLCTEGLPDGGSISYEYDGRGRVSKKTTQTGSQNFVESYVYDLRGLLQSVARPDGSLTSYAYRGEYPVSVSFRKTSGGSTDPLVSSVKYNAAGQIAEIIHANGTVTTNTYDANALNRLTRRTVVAPNGFNTTVTTTSTTTYTSSSATFYSTVGDGKINASGTPWSSVRAASTGNADSTSDRGIIGVETSPSYYSLNRGFFSFDTTSIPDEDTVTSAALKIYVATAASDNLSEEQDWLTVVKTTQSSSTTLVSGDFDEVGGMPNPVEGIDPSNRIDIYGLNYGQYLSFPLNAVGNSWVSATSTTKLGVIMGFDLTNTPPSSNNRYAFLRIYFRENGLSTAPKLEVTYLHPTTVVTSTTTTTPIFHTVQDTSYVYDAVGNITGVTESASATARAVTYAYDDLDRLLSASATSGATSLYSESYTYGPTGNVLTKTASMGGGTPVVSTYAYAGTGNANPHAATSVGALALAYDADGNLTSSGSTTYAWDGEGRLASATGTGWTANYSYDASGRRLTASGTSSTEFFPSDAYSWSSAGSGESRTDVLLGSLRAAVSTRQGTSDPTIRLIHADHLGGTSVATNLDGSIAESLAYYPYGGSQLDTGNGTGVGGAAPPDTSIASHPDAQTTDTSAGFTFSSTDTSATFECRLDGSAWSACSSPKSYSGLSYATHLFEARALGAGGSDPSPAVWGWAVYSGQTSGGTITPITTAVGYTPGNGSNLSFTINIPSGKNNVETVVSFWSGLGGGGIPTITSVTIDGNSGTQLRTANNSGDGSNWVCGTYRFDGLSAGSHTIAINHTGGGSDPYTYALAAAYDNVDQTTPIESLAAITNFSGTSVQRTVTTVTDKSYVLMPVMQYDYGQASAQSGTTKRVETDPSNSWNILFDSESVVTPAGNKTLGANFVRSAKGYAFGFALKPAPATAPDTAISVHPDAQTTDTSASFTFSSTSTPITFECKLDGGSWSACTSPKSYSGLSYATHLFEVRALGAGGTDPSPAVWGWAIQQPTQTPTLGTFSDRRKFAGYFQEPSGLQYLGARYYDPTTGRFLSEDPAFLDLGDTKFANNYKRSLADHLSNPQSLNSYSYANGNPLRYRDPDGKIAQVILGVLAVYGYVSLGIQGYDAKTVLIDHPDVFTEDEKGRVKDGLIVSGVLTVGGGVASGIAKGIGSGARDAVNLFFGSFGAILDAGAAVKDYEKSNTNGNGNNDKPKNDALVQPGNYSNPPNMSQPINYTPAPQATHQTQQSSQGTPSSGSTYLTNVMIGGRSTQVMFCR